MSWERGGPWEVRRILTRKLFHPEVGRQFLTVVGSLVQDLSLANDTFLTLIFKRQEFNSPYHPFIHPSTHPALTLRVRHLPEVPAALLKAYSLSLDQRI